MENQHPMVGHHHSGNARGDRRPDVGHGLGGTARPITSHRHPSRQAEHRQSLDPAPGRTMSHRIGRGVRRVRVEHTAHIGMILLQARVHGDHCALNGRQFTFEQRSVQPHPSDAGRSMVPQRRTTGEVHLARSRDAKTHVSVPVRANCATSHEPLGHQPLGRPSPCPWQPQCCHCGQHSSPRMP